MTLILFVALVVVGALLFDTRRRLSEAEAQASEALSIAQAAMRKAEEVRTVPVAAPVAPPEEQPAPPPEPREVSAPVVRRAAYQAPPRAPVVVHVTRPVEPMAEPVVEPVVSHADEEASSGFEDLFGRKLPIWGGGITLLVAAVLLVRYSIEAGLLSPLVRTIGGWLFGLGLIGGAEAARRIRIVADDPRVAQALAGAGIGSLYAATLAAANLYGLIGPGLAFGALTAITALALGLALRFGVPSAILGLVGGVATPVLVQSDAPNVPLLAAYLALVIGGLTLLSRHQRWFWLGVSALIGGAGWSALLIIAGGLGSLSTASVGMLVIVLGLGLPLFGRDDDRAWMVQGATAAVAALQLAMLVASGGFALLNWGLYGLLAIGFVGLTIWQAALRPLILLPLVTALILAAIWPEPAMTHLGVVMVGIVLIFGGEALWRLWRADGGMLEAGRIVALSVGGYAVCHWHVLGVEWARDIRLSLVAAAFALLPVAALAIGWRRADRHDDLRFGTLGMTAGAMAIVVALMALPGWLAPVSIAAIAVGLLLTAEQAGDALLARNAAAYAVVAALFAPLTDPALAETSRLFGLTVSTDMMSALLRWAAPALAGAFFTWRLWDQPVARPLAGFAALLVYGAAAQVIPATALAPAVALGLVAIAEVMRRRYAAELLPAFGVLGLIAWGWALLPLGEWFLPAGASLFGDPFLVRDLPSLASSIERVLAPALLAGMALFRLRGFSDAVSWRAATAGAAAAAMIGVHMAYKHLFAIDDALMFESLGLAERTVWQVLLLGVGVVAWRAKLRWWAALPPVAMALVHAVYYSLWLHDPLWAPQAVGPWPVANLIVPMAALIFGALLLAERVAPQIATRAARPITILRMATILFLGLASLRQIFCGSLFAPVPMGSVEDIGRSVILILIAIGFLLWGIRVRARDWRIGSLVLMLAAVMKVFLVDASGAEGLLRIASFLALGFSLIGLGWLYSRYLRVDADRGVM
ncbi:DUF2339 domain-containing protein [Sphingomonas crocodyli]|nr:DUF2339 domain-containing protein [Sphingomonas crocodyli]